ncbi:hypothetical protein C6P42_002704 [Pichia californica]|nr:hypothetical protein C6P42_002704 [[Candida] californica]
MAYSRKRTQLTSDPVKVKLENDGHEGDQIDFSKVKRTTRVIKSCTKCKERKVKCNFEIPCDRCIARNQAHLCSREPIIFDGMYINNNNTKELKYSQENDILKKKISELQDVISKLKSIVDERMPSDSSINEPTPEDSFNFNVPSYSRFKLNEVILNNRLTSTKSDTKDKDLINWNVYSSTVSILDKALTNGLMLDGSNSSANEMDYNTEEWLLLKDKSYQKYKADDSKSKCWLYELDLLLKLDKNKCDLLVNSGLKIDVVFPIIDKEQFLKEYEEYWADESIPEKHLTSIHTKTAENYALLALMYSLMCLGLYQCDEKDRKKLNFSYYDWDNYSRGLFSASLDSLYKSRYMTYPKVRSIQIISFLRILAGFLGGINLSACLIGTSFMITYKLDLMGITDKYKVNNVWNTLAYDWYDDQERYSLTTLSYMKSLPKLEKYFSLEKSEKKLIDWAQYQLYNFVSVAIIKKKYYFGGNDGLLNNLKNADVELRYLKIQATRDFDSYNIDEYPNISDEMIQCIKYHVDAIINHEILQVNLKMSKFLTYQEWTKNCYPACYSSALQQLESFTSKYIPVAFKSFPFIFQYITYSILFLIIDSMLDKHHKKNQRHIMRIAKKIMNVFKSFKVIIRGVIRGVYVIKKLLGLMRLKRKEDETKNAKRTKFATHRTKINQDNVVNENHTVMESNEPVESNDRSSVIVNDNDAKGKGVGDNGLTGKEVKENQVNPINEDNFFKIDQNNKENDYDESDDSSDSESDDDLPLYCSTLEQHNKSEYTNIAAQNQMPPANAESVPLLVNPFNVSETPCFNFNSNAILPVNNVLPSTGNQFPIQNSIMNILEDRSVKADQNTRRVSRSSWFDEHHNINNNDENYDTVSYDNEKEVANISHHNLIFRWIIFFGKKVDGGNPARDHLANERTILAYIRTALNMVIYGLILSQLGKYIIVSPINGLKGKVHGSLARAGKVKSQTPKVEKTEKPKKPKGRAYKRLLYTKRFVNAAITPGGKRKMNSNAK